MNLTAAKLQCKQSRVWIYTHTEKSAMNSAKTPDPKMYKYGL